MAREHRGTGLLLLLAAAAAMAVGAGVYWVTRPPLRATIFQIYHWVPGPGPLKIVGIPPLASEAGADVSALMDVKLRDLLREMNLTGELRLVGEADSFAFPRPLSNALILRNPPTKPHTLPLFDTRSSLYVEAGTGYQLLPGGAPPLDDSVTFTPGKGNPPTSFDFTLIRGGPSGKYGSLRLWWW